MNRKSITTEDFSVAIKKLPSSVGFNNIKEYKALLWDHLENIIKRERQVIPKLVDEKINQN